MEAIFDGTVVRAGERARERFYDSRGYGRPEDGALVLDPVEAAHLLYRGDLGTVRDGRAGTDDGPLDFHALLGTAAVSEVAYVVYADLRDRGFYLSPVGQDRFEVYPRGSGPWDDALAYLVSVASEREDVPATDLRGLADDRAATGVLAVVDEESEVTYFAPSRPTIAGSTYPDLPGSIDGTLLADRVLVPDPPSVLVDRTVFGHPLNGSRAGLLLSLVEAAYLAAQDVLTVDGGRTAVIERGTAIEGERFDRRLRAYTALRTAGIAPKTGFKFGADFRTYAHVESADELGHSELLIRVLPPDHVFAPRDLALDVRLAGGVRKQMVYAIATDEITWLAVDRLTP